MNTRETAQIAAGDTNTPGVAPADAESGSGQTRAPRKPRAIRPPRPPRAPSTGFRKGDIVRIERDRPSRGSWPQFDGRTGTVIVANNLGEIGVNLGNGNSAIDAWFLPDELVKTGWRDIEPATKAEVTS